MRNNLLFALLAGCCWLLNPVQAAEIAVSSGEENYLRLCAACHGEGGRGDGPVAGAIIKPIPDLTRIAARNKGEFPRQIIKNSIDGRWQIDAHGTQQMPVWGYEFWVNEKAGNFSESEVSRILDGLVDFLASIQQP